MKNRIFVLGLDGATLDLIIPWVEKDKLPVIKKIMNEGSYGPLRSTIHPMTAPAWTSFMTGTNPGKHGMYDFVRRRVGAYKRDIVNATHRSGDSLWKILSENGKQVCVINVPMTYPPEDVNGYMVSGFDTPDMKSSYTHPDSLAREISDLHVIAVDTAGKSHSEYLQASLRAVEKRFKVMEKLYGKVKFDFFMKVITETDSVQHCFWESMAQKKKPYEDAIYSVYQRIDTLLGDFLMNWPDDSTLIIMSDHGAGPIKKVFHLDAYLRRLGLIHYKEHKSTSFIKSLAHSAGKNLLVLSQRHLPQSLKAKLKQMTTLRSDFESYLEFSEIDWPRTKAYSMGNQGNICINLKGREPQGIVSPGREYEALCQMLIENITRLRDPETNDFAVDRVYSREELYHGPMVHLAPDLLIRWRDDLYFAKKDLNPSQDTLWSDHVKFGRYSSDYDMYQTGTHKLNGVAIFYGNMIKKGARLQKAEIIDLAPTILYLLNEYIPDNMDGDVLASIIDEKYLNVNPIKYKKTRADKEKDPDILHFSKKDEEKVRRRLKSLGYMDD